MIVHQKPYLPTSKLISLGMTQGLVFEKLLRRKMKWALYGEWTNKQTKSNKDKRCKEPLELQNK